MMFMPWSKILMILAIYFVVQLAINYLLRKWLKVKRKKLFSYNHLNEKHKKIDWTIRIITIVLLVIGTTINATRIPTEQFWFLQTYFILFMMIFSTETTRAIMEKKYAENRNDYLYTTFQLIFASILVISIFTTDFWGFFS
ncbi:DUF4181 domain-containing protein [Falsibacillus albus]|uniref:DUF4181 domain-containing protein n=2 Tax=Falsibacillus albus TaxID=2478915 RepID=A0A3L7JNB3_9BACI|nr:DUF4181 domain-containing protein [Falsibacillus albus]